MQIQFHTQCQEFLKSRNLRSGKLLTLPTAEIILQELLISEPGDRTRAVTGSVDGFIVKQDSFFVRGQGNVALCIPEAFFLCHTVCDQGIFGSCIAVTSVGDGMDFPLKDMSGSSNLHISSVIAATAGFICLPSRLSTGR